jgi:acyl-CoA thioesterase FadM
VTLRQKVPVEIDLTAHVVEGRAQVLAGDGLVAVAEADLRARRFCLLGSLEASQVRPVAVADSLVVAGWTRGLGGRSVQTASAMIDEDGAVVASARAVWVAVRHQWPVKTIARFVG